MNRRPGPRRLLGMVAGAAGGLAGLAGLGYLAQRAAAARLRGRPDADAAGVLQAAGYDPYDRYASHHLASHDGGRIHVVDSGTGPPVVLSHGVTLAARTWVYQLEELPAAGLRVLAYDHRGHGQSVVGEEGHSVEVLGDDVRSVLEGLDLRGAVLVGHSMGGVAVQSFVIRHPDVARERLRGIVLLSTLARTPLGSRSTRLRTWMEALTDRVPDTTRLWAAPNLGFLLARIGFGRDPKPSHVELVRRMMVDCPADTRRDAPRALIGLDFTEALREVDLPTLVMCGTADVLTPPAEARRLARLVPGARLELFPGGGHMLMLEQANRFNRLLVEFVSRCVQPSGPAS